MMQYHLFARNKKGVFTIISLKNCPSSFDCFEFILSVGASGGGGGSMSWKSNRFNGHIIDRNAYAMIMEFVSTFSGVTWVLTNIYAPCTPEGKMDFLNWLHDFDLPGGTDWLLVGDFNLIRWPSDRNKLGGNVQYMFIFNEAINYLGLQELPLQGNKFTWSNKQVSPLLERLG
jgi:hypothetical protein